jgi:hypothetical protein
MVCHVDCLIFTEVSKEQGAFIFKDKQSERIPFHFDALVKLPFTLSFHGSSHAALFNIYRVFFDVWCAVVMHFSAWSAVY